MLNENNYKLYRNIYEIIHPSISRKNISEYKIILNEEIIPIKIFYPKKEVELNKIMIYVHSNDINYKFYEKLAYETNYIIFLLDYSKDNINKDCKKAIEFIVKDAKDSNISEKNIVIAGDFLGANIILELENIAPKIKKILFSPTITDLEKIKTTNLIILSNNEKVKTNKDTKLFLIKESLYDFINDSDLIVNEVIYRQINEYINGDEK